MTSIWFWITECLWLYDYSSPRERPVNLSRRVPRGSHSDAQRRSATQKLELAIFLDISWVSASSVTSWCIFNTTSKYVCAITFYSWKADVFIHRLLNHVNSRWIAINFSDNWKWTASTRQRFIQQVAGNPRWGRFTIETPLQRERELEIQREQPRRRARNGFEILA